MKVTRRPVKPVLAHLKKKIALVPSPRLDAFYTNQSYQEALGIHRETTGFKTTAIALEKLLQYMDHYGIDRDDGSAWMQLSLFLAFDFAPGFEITFKTAGRKVSWSQYSLARLYFEVMDQIERKALKGTAVSVSWACEQLAKKQPWRGADIDSRTLKNRFGIARNHSFVQTFKDEIEANPALQNYVETFKRIIYEKSDKDLFS